MLKAADPLGGCSQYDPFIIEGDFPLYFLVEGRDGGCTYAQKVKMAKKTAAHGVIIIDSEKAINNLRPKKNDNFQTFLMPEAQGDKLVKAMEGKKNILARISIGD